MKSIILALALTLSTSAFARQYIQCGMANSSDVAVVNLQTIDGGTLFLSSGMQNPDDERILVKIQLAQVSGAHHIYQVINENFEGYLRVPSDVIGKSSDMLLVDLKAAGYSLSYSCFSRIYND